VVKNAISEFRAPVFYVNQVTGHDDLVFDGGSFVMSRNGNIFSQMSFFKEETVTFDIDEVIGSKPKALSKIDETGHMYQAMMLGLKDYVEKNNFPGVLIGLSGGIDSALSAAVAVDALGSDKVKLVMMPTKYTSGESTADAKKMAKNLGVELDEINIQPIVTLLRLILFPHFEGRKEDTTEENLQSRVRGIILMALSNKLGHLLLSTGNKSEMATGYATLYGDMCGGYNVLKDIYKTKIFKICDWRNKNIPGNSKLKKAGIIPQNIIAKPPTAELRYGQKDEDSLPPYEMLEKILFNFIELQNSADDIVKKGFNRKMVSEVEKLVYRAEYKRRQSAPGVKISSKPFGRDRRYPITNKFLD
jgi:NAD+ synthase